MNPWSASVRLLFAMRIVRLFAYGILGVMLVLYLAAAGLGEARIGLLLTLTFLGDALISLWLSTHADRWGRRRVLIAGAVLMALGGVVMALTGDFTLLVIAATIGVISPSGAEVGPFLAVEQACLAQLVSPGDRTRIFAWYNVAGYTAAALGSLAGGLVAAGLQRTGWSPLASYRALLVVYGVVGLLVGTLAWRLDADVETETDAAPKRILGLDRSRATIFKLSAIFSLDSFGGGFIVQSFLAYWFYLRFGADDAALGAIFFVVNLVSGLSALAAVPIARRIGLLNTMVWTHLPSNVLLMAVPLMPTFGWAVTLLVLRHTISQMDMPTRQSYVNAVVPPGERSAANGITGVARQLGTALAPLCSAPLIGAAAATPFFVAGGVKIVYDLILWRNFRAIKPPEEVAPAEGREPTVNLPNSR